MGVQPNGETEGGEAITAEGLEALKAEIERLEGEERETMAARLKVARELGDLKENAEYHIAKEDQAHLETRIRDLKERLANAVVTEGAGSSSDTFSFGATAEVTDSEGRTHTWKLVGSTEADLAAGLISAESPIGMALRDHKVGDDVAVETPAGTRSYRIDRLV
ncbi:MAG: transcription elongation factor GreA [Solirubrobacterales bacterium]